MLTVLSAPTAESTAVLWQPIPVAAQPAEETAVCLAVSTVAWIARPPVWQDAQAVVVSLADQLPAIVEVDAVLLWQFRHTLAFVVLAEVDERVLGVQAAVAAPRRGRRHTRSTAKVAIAWTVLLGACLAASAAWAWVVPV